MESPTMKKVVSGLLVLLCGFFLLTASTAEAETRPTLRVGYTSMPGYLSRDYKYHYKGVAYEYLRQLPLILASPSSTSLAPKKKTPCACRSAQLT